MCRRLLIVVLIIVGVSVATASAQKPQARLDPTQPLVLIMKSGEWKWVKGLKRNGPMFEFYEASGRHVKTERYVSMPADLVDVDAVVGVNKALMSLGVACSNGDAANVEINLEGRARKIFVELASRTVFIGERGEEIKGCFFETPMGQAIVNEMNSQYRRSPRPTPTPWPTPTWEEKVAAEAEFRAQQAAKTPRAETTTTQSLRYQVVKTESYSAWIGGRFADGAKVHVIPEDWGRVKDIAKEIARSKRNRGVVVYFWKAAGDVGKQAAVFGVEIIDGQISETLVDQR